MSGSQMEPASVLVGRRRKLLLLGGSRFLQPVIEAARELECHVITMDYLPNNDAHALSDEYVNVSVVDREAVLAAAKKLGVDGIMSFACDAGAVSAAYAAERLGLASVGPLESVSVLQNKPRFRRFLRDNGFNCPTALTFASADEAQRSCDDVPYPAIVKPADSAGSKGCERVDGPETLRGAVERALEFSITGTCIVEQFIEKACPSSDSDCFTVDGRFECVSFTAQYFDDQAANPYAPAAYGMPSGIPKAASLQLTEDLRHLANLLDMRTGVYNVETRVGTNGLPYIMEASPRGGGNRLCELLRYASGVDLIKASVVAALGEQPQGVEMPEYDGFWYEVMLHSERGGTYCGIEYAGGFSEEHVIDEQVWIAEGAHVNAFRAGGDAFGSVIMRFDTQQEFEAFRTSGDELMRVKVV